MVSEAEMGGPESVQNAGAPAENTPNGAAGETSVIAGLTLGSTGAAAAGETEAAVARLPKTLRGRLLPDGSAIGTGRRKTSVARVRIRRGTGKFTINNRDIEDYFHVERDRIVVHGPLQATGLDGQIDVWVRASGGGTTGQTGAIILGIARALQALNPELHAQLSDGSFLTRDGRMVERKKYGRRKARRSFQFSKR